MECPDCGRQIEETNHCPSCGAREQIAAAPPKPLPNPRQGQLASPIIVLLGLWVLAVAVVIDYIGTQHHWSLLLIAVTPALGFLALVLYLDRHEPEPLSQVLFLMGLGALGTIAALRLELLMRALPPMSWPGLLGTVSNTFGRIAVIEEACKLLPVLLFIWRRNCLDEENDGIVYTVASALGFAVVENILFVTQAGLSVGIARAITAVPLHTFTGVIMGYFVGVSHFEPGIRRYGLIGEGYLLAVLFHGLYDTLASFLNMVWVLLPTMMVLGVGIYYMFQARIRSGLRRKGSARLDELLGRSCLVSTVSESTPIPVWRVWLSRLLIAATGLLWVAFSVFYLQWDQSARHVSLLLFGILVGLVPALIGIVLEQSAYPIATHNPTQDDDAPDD